MAFRGIATVGGALLAALLGACSAVPLESSAPWKPKYGPAGAPRAVPLSRSHEFFQSPDQPAPDFWALLPYYAAAENDRSCSVATAVMLVNAARAAEDLSSSDPLATHASLLERAGVEDWSRSVRAGTGDGVTLDELATFLSMAFDAHGIALEGVDVVRFESASGGGLDALREILLENEASSRDFVAVNFLQSAFTADADAGHMAPIGAYDARRRSVLVLDPDREWYEPYWVSEETLLEGMMTVDPSTGRTRGLVRVRRRRRKGAGRFRVRCGAGPVHDRGTCAAPGGRPSTSAFWEDSRS
jgi:hypothetical protein